MTNYTKDELMAMADAEIVGICGQLGVGVSQKDSKEDVVYRILEEQALRGAAEQQDAPKRSRMSKAKKETAKAGTDKSKADEAEPQPAKRRGRPRKTETTDDSSAKAAANSDNKQSNDNNSNVAARDNQEQAKAKKDSDAVADEQPAPTEKKRRGRPRKTKSEEPSAAETANAVATNPSADTGRMMVDLIKDANTTTRPEPVPMPGNAADSGEDNGEDFIILHDIPSGSSLIDSDVNMSAIDGMMDDDLFGDDSSDSHSSVSDALPAAMATGKSDEPVHTLTGSGVLEIMPEHYGFLRSSDYNYLSSPDDIFISQAQIKNYGLCSGDVVEGTIRMPRDKERYFVIESVSAINGCSPRVIRDRVPFEHLTPLFPDEKFTLCKGHGDNLSVRFVDLFTPIGKGQRALIVAQPKTGKTTLMKDVANAIAANHPEAYLMMLLIDERPEEVTDMARTVNAEVIASTFDEPAANHVRIANIVLDKAKRMVECGHDVVIFLDSITRLARAYNAVAPASGKVLTGGVDSNALQKPKRFFGAARNIEGGGSLTIVATALIDTGSKMDEVIFEEFKGTGNMELQLDRSLSNKRIFPSINCVASSTRRDDLLQDPNTRELMWMMRKVIAEMKPIEAMNIIMERMEKSRNHDEFFKMMNG